MDFLNALNDGVLFVADPLLNWLLRLPSDVALFIVAIGTSMILTFVRLVTTNQDLLKRVKYDKKRVKELMRDAKAKKDKDAKLRYRTTMQGLGVKAMKAEGKPLLVSLLPIAVLAVWAFCRLGYHPAVPGQEVEVKAWLKISAIGRTALLVPQDGLETTTTWIRPIEDDPDSAGGTNRSGVVTWKVKAQPSAKPYPLVIRYAGQEFNKATLLVSGRKYTSTLDFYDAEKDAVVATQVSLKEVKLFGIVPGLEIIMFPPWLVAYLLIAVPFVFLLKWIFKIE